MPPVRSWSLSGNAGTNPPTDFLGTTDDEPLAIATGGTQRISVGTNGYVGVNTGAPNSMLEVAQTGTAAVTVTNSGGGEAGIDFNTSQPAASGTYNPSSRVAALPQGNDSDDIAFFANSPGAPNSGLVERMRVAEKGVGIGTSTPVTALDVRGQACSQGALAINNSAATPGLGSEGDARAAITFGATDTPAGFYLGAYTSDTQANTVFGLYSYFLKEWLQLWSPDGNISVSGDILLTGADCAEQFDARDSSSLTPGTVVVIGEDGRVGQSCRPYDTAVAGVVSGAGDYRHALVLDTRPSDEGRVPVALVGKVFCNVDATYSAVAAGDLLTTSPTPGHAMKACESARAAGAIIGKALRPLDRGQSLVPILVTLR
jgi:hypothetical protein